MKETIRTRINIYVVIELKKNNQNVHVPKNKSGVNIACQT